MTHSKSPTSEKAGLRAIVREERKMWLLPLEWTSTPAMEDFIVSCMQIALRRLSQPAPAQGENDELVKEIEAYLKRGERPKESDAIMLAYLIEAQPLLRRAATALSRTDSADTAEGAKA